MRFEKSLLRVRLSAKNDKMISGRGLWPAHYYCKDKYLYSEYIIYEWWRGRVAASLLLQDTYLHVVYIIYGMRKEGVI